MKSMPMESIVATLEEWLWSQSAPYILVVWLLKASSNSFLSRSKMKRLPLVPPMPRYLPLEDNANLPEDAGIIKSGCSSVATVLRSLSYVILIS